MRATNEYFLYVNRDGGMAWHGPHTHMHPFFIDTHLLRIFLFHFHFEFLFFPAFFRYSPLLQTWPSIFIGALRGLGDIFQVLLRSKWAGNYPAVHACMNYLQAGSGEGSSLHLLSFSLPSRIRIRIQFRNENKYAVLRY